MLKIDRRRVIAAGSAALALPFIAKRADAQSPWQPTRQIRMLCGFPAGGQTDLLGRAYGDFIARTVGQNVIVENKPGASSSIANAEVARAAPDGHTILLSLTTGYVMNRVLIRNPGYDTEKDLTLLSGIPGAGLLLVASPKCGARNLEEFLAYTRKTGRATFGTYSAGSAAHMTAAELKRQYNVDIEPVHYRGEAPMWNDLASQSIDVAMGSYTAAQSVLQGNRGILFAVHSKRVSAIPDVKTLPEQGATSKFFSISGFTGWAVPKATPQPIVDRLSQLFVAGNNDPKVKEVLATFVLEPTLSHQETNALYVRELPIWLEVAKEMGLQPA